MYRELRKRGTRLYEIRICRGPQSVCLLRMAGESRIAHPAQAGRFANDIGISSHYRQRGAGIRNFTYPNKECVSGIG
jgi:hypothetical protein